MRRALACLGLLGLAPIGLGLLEGRLTLTEAGWRAGVLALVLLVLGKAVLPAVSRLIGPSRNGEFLIAPPVVKAGKGKGKAKDDGDGSSDGKAKKGKKSKKK